MMTYTTGDLLQSEAEALVNTVNCEGYMGKGIAYQFKLRFPENNKSYVKACRNGSMRVGKMHWHREQGKFIINFPTKDRWRRKSKMVYIEEGLDALINLVEENDIQSIAIPPLGSGNGGLEWLDVRDVIEKKLKDLSEKVNIIIYEPSMNYKAKAVTEPKLSVSALVLMTIKRHLTNFGSVRLQKTAFFMNIFSGDRYFRFDKYTYGPYDNVIAIISRDIKAYQDYHNVKNTDEAYKILYRKLTSSKTEEKLNKLGPAIEKAAAYVNSIESDHELECLSTLAYIIQETPMLDEDDIVHAFGRWSARKSSEFSSDEIRYGISKLCNDGIIEKIITGYVLK